MVEEKCVLGFRTKISWPGKYYSQELLEDRVRDRRTGKELSWNDSYKEEERSTNNTSNNLGEEVRNILTALKADEEIGNLDEEKVAITEEVSEVLKKERKTSYQLLEIYQRRCY